MSTTLPAEFRDSVVYWFCRLESARNHQDYEAAADAIRELRRLGVEIRFTGATK